MAAAMLTRHAVMAAAYADAAACWRLIYVTDMARYRRCHVSDVMMLRSVMPPILRFTQEAMMLSGFDCYYGL